MKSNVNGDIRLKTEEEIRKMLKKAIRHPEIFQGDARVTIQALRWVLNELQSSDTTTNEVEK